MILRGILDNCLNGQLCVRGFAPIKELARISKADYSYQRNPIDRKDILDFLEKQTYLFSLSRSTAVFQYLFET